MAVYGPKEEDLSQGDVIQGVPFLVRRGRDVDYRHQQGLVVSHSCEIDKYKEALPTADRNVKLSWPVAVAPLYGLDLLDSGQQGDARAGRHKRYFYLAAEGNQPALVADFWLQQPVPIDVINKLPRPRSLSEEWRFRMYLHAFVALTRLAPKDVFAGGTLAH